jgi:hypothetical protein
MIIYWQITPITLLWGSTRWLWRNNEMANGSTWRKIGLVLLCSLNIYMNCYEIKFGFK